MYIILFYFITINLFEFFSGNYIYKEIEGNLVDGNSFNFSLVTRNSNGIIFYGIDSRTKILIKFGNHNNSNEIILKYKDFKIIKKLFDICGLGSHFYWKFNLKLDNLKINITCNQRESSLTFIERVNYDQFIGFPVPQNFYKDFPRIFIWIGNIGPFNSIGNQVVKPVRQLEGCLHKFYFKGKLIKFIENGTKLLTYCLNEYNETIRFNNKSAITLSSYDLDDCSLVSMNGRFCKPRVYNNKKCSYYSIVKDNNNESISLKSDWHFLFVENYCLMELKSRNGLIITILINKNNEIEIETSRLNDLYKNVSVLTADIIMLLVQFNYTNFVIKIYTKDEITTFVYPFLGYPYLVNVGFSEISKTCKQFQGFLNFQYNSSQFEMECGNKYLFRILSILFVVFLSIIAMILTIYLITKKLSPREISLYFNQYYTQTENRFSNFIKSPNKSKELSNIYHVKPDEGIYSTID